ncbi:FxLYD domain-containing protein [Streptomyces sp. NPDC029674]|uniref:FxLYD domain-containing protein n=1 Tax=Streptomyces sp. NPDC029674 TaxID=3365297 RepID=UPI00384E91C8
MARFGDRYGYGDRYRASGAAAAACVAALALLTAGCSDGDGGGNVSDAASKAASAVASASARAGEKIHEIKGGIDAKGDVRLGKPSTDGDGRTTVKVTADNTGDSSKSFAVQVTFKNADGKLLDTVVTRISDVPAGKSKDATARSTHKLDGGVKADVATAVRY